MGISAISSYATQNVDEIVQTRRTATTAERTSRGDTVTFSAEGRALAAQMQAEKAAAAGGSTDNGAGAFADNPESSEQFVGDDSAGGKGTESVAQPEGGGGGGGSASSPSDQIESLRARIKELSAQLQQIMSGSGSPETKVTLGAPLQQQIATLEQELQQLQAAQSQQG